eukprot:7382741-Prymnesium_polylepis.2
MPQPAQRAEQPHHRAADNLERRLVRAELGERGFERHTVRTRCARGCAHGTDMARAWHGHGTGMARTWHGSMIGHIGRAY